GTKGSRQRQKLPFLDLRRGPCLSGCEPIDANGHVFCEEPLAISRVPDAVQRILRCTAQPGPTLPSCSHGPGSAAHHVASAARCAASGERSARLTASSLVVFHRP